MVKFRARVSICTFLVQPCSIHYLMKFKFLADEITYSSYKYVSTHHSITRHVMLQYCVHDAPTSMLHFEHLFFFFF